MGHIRVTRTNTVYNMASTQPFVLISLCEDDVPGARFLHENVEDHTVIQLKRWLECRSLPTSGTKPQLVQRCKDCIDNGQQHKINVAVDGGKWFQHKVLQHSANKTGNSTNISQVPVLPVLGWKQFPSVNIPSLYNYGHMYHYLVESAVTITGSESGDECDNLMDVHTAKPLRRAEQYVDSGHIQDVQDIQGKGHYYMKARVKSSFKDDMYIVQVTISQASGSVADASCECRASAMGRCSHVGALLLYLTRHIDANGRDPVACTSLPCTWNTGSRINRTPKRLHQTNYHEKSKCKKLKQMKEYDPCKIERPPVNERKNSFLQILNSDLPSCSWIQTMDMHYGDYILEDDRQQVLREQCGLFVASMQEQVQELCGTSHVGMIPGTESQSEASEWHGNRWCRITASSCKEVVHCTEVGRGNLVKKLLWSQNLKKSQAMRYGTDNEQHGLAAYTAHHAHVDGFRVIRTGLWVNRDFPEFGCSPDGLVYDPAATNKYGLLEIKCPYVLRDGDPKVPGNCLTAKQLKTYCSEINRDCIKLKRNHQYFYQVQMQMGITGLSWCDFVLWSKRGIHVERIDFDVDLWNTITDKCRKFYHNVYLPEYFEMRLPRGLSVFKVD